MAKPSLLRGNALIGQSGGPTAVINQALVGVVAALRGQKPIHKILGCVHGVRGIIDNHFVDLKKVPAAQLELVAQTPSSALGSSRDKPDRDYCKKILESFAAQDIRYFFYIGGNDSSDTCRIVNELAKEQRYELTAFHVPKTIDNDLMHNDHCPGFGSAARFVACAFLGDDLDNRALPGVKINVVMGRHAGFLTAASVLAKQSDKHGPHLIYVPEVSFSVDKFLADVDRVYKAQGRCVIAVSEGIHDANKKEMAVKLAEDLKVPVERDAHGNVQLSGSGALGDFLGRLIKDRLKIKRVRADTLGYLQRSFVGCTSVVDAKEARRAGQEAARQALKGVREGSIAIQRVSDKPYKVIYKRIELSDVAAKTRTMDLSYIVDGCMIAPSFVRYLQPLVGPLPKTARLPW